MTSKIKVDNIENQCGGAVVTKCGATTTISGSVVKADDIQAADGGNLINQCGTTITLGASGDTINLASGASQTGFGRTGTVDWDTTAKTASFTAVSGNGYFVNTTSGAVTVTMPATPSAGDIVGIKDYAGTFATNNVTVGRNGSLIDGIATDAILDTDNLSVFFVYVDGTQGWKATQNDSGFYGASYIVATGGTETTCGDYKIHTFTGPGTFTVCSAGNPSGSTTVDYLVVAGGGGGGKGSAAAGGGGAGGMRFSATTYCSPSPLKGPTALPVSATGYPITVGGGGGGRGSPNSGNDGNNSVFSSITSTGGGGGGGGGESPAPPRSGRSGGSGGGAAYQPPGPGSAPATSAGVGNTPPVSPSQGNPGGTGGPQSGTHAGGGGGGFTAAGAAGINPQPIGGCGGAGLAISITGSPVAYAGGGGGGIQSGNPDNSGDGGIGGGAGGGKNAGGVTNGGAGTANTGGGGGGSGPGDGGAGGSGIVIIRYKFQ